MEQALHTHHREQDFGIPVCLEHSGVCMNIQGIKEDIIRADAINTQNHEAQWKAIDKLRDSVDRAVTTMTRWAVGAMGALILALFSWVLTNFHIIK